MNGCFLTGAVTVGAAAFRGVAGFGYALVAPLTLAGIGLVIIAIVGLLQTIYALAFA